tara:strand:- start:1000 stop:1317 length:318 start_codon:yes stop_codon:yes gene_type:complete
MNNLLTLLGLGMDMGANFDNLSMAQKRTALGNMFDPMEAGRERLRAMTATQPIMGNNINPFLLEGLLGGIQQPEAEPLMPVMPQQILPTQQIPVIPQLNYYRGIL